MYLIKCLVDIVNILMKINSSTRDFYNKIYNYYDRYILLKDGYSQKNFNYWFSKKKYINYDKYIKYTPREY